MNRDRDDPRLAEDSNMEEDLITFDYQRHVRLYTLLIPVTTVLTCAICATPLYLTTTHVIRIDEILLPTALWALSYVTQKHIERWSRWRCWWGVSALLRATTHTLLLLSAPYLLRIAHNADYPIPSKYDEVVFLRTWVLGMTWGVVEAVVSIRSAYHSFSLYAPLLLDDDDDDESSVISTNLSLLNHLHKRAELEEVLAGVSFIDIPLFILALQRASACLYSLGVTLLATASWYPSMSFTFRIVVVLLSIAIHTSIGMLRAPQVRVYVGLVLGLGLFFAGLGVWGVLE